MIGVVGMVLDMILAYAGRWISYRE
jgi:nitrate/nitrite transport system permease protein